MLSFLKKNSGLRNSTLAVFFVFSIVGLMNVTIAAYTPPTCPPPGCNTDAPINVGTTPQFKYGNLTITSPTATGTIISDLLWTNYGAVINADGGGASGVGLLVPRDKVGIGFSGIGTDLPQAKLDVNGTTISRGSLVVGTSTPSWATLDVNGTINSRGNLTVGTSTGVGGSRQLNIFGDIVVSDVPVTSPTGFIFRKRGIQESNRVFSGATPDFSWWQETWPFYFGDIEGVGSTTWSGRKLTSVMTAGGCDDGSLVSRDCTADFYTAVSNPVFFSLAFDLYAYQLGTDWKIGFRTYQRVSDKRVGGSLSSVYFNANDAAISNLNVLSELNAQKIHTSGTISARRLSADEIYSSELRTQKLCLIGGDCIASSTLLGVWEESTSTGSFAGSIFYDGGRVGIGTGGLGPLSQLHLKDDASEVRHIIENTKNGGISAISLSRKTTGGVPDQWSISALGPGGQQGLFFKDDASGIPTSLSLIYNGKVGIGTDTPQGLFDVVGSGDIRLKPGSLEGGRVIIGDNGLVHTTIHGNLSLSVQDGGLRYSPGADNSSIGNNRDYSFIVDPQSLSGADAWDLEYTSNRLSCDATLGGAECLSQSSWPAGGGDPAVKYDLYAFQSAGPVGLCGVPPNTGADSSCRWKKAVRTYTKSSGSGGDLFARKGRFSENFIIGGGKTGYLAPLVEANLDPYGLAVAGKVSIGSIITQSLSLNVAGGILADKICLTDTNPSNCKTSWATSPDLWATSTNGIFFDAGQGNVGIGDVPTTKPLTIYGNPTAWIQLRDSNSVDKWHITGFGGGFNLAESGVADGRIFVQALTGNVGIGLTNPTTKLDVQGTIKANGKVQANEYCDLAGINCTPLPFPSNSTQNGYVRIGNVLMQWGYIDGPLTQNSYNVDFPIAFSNPPFNLNCTARNGDTFNHNDDTWCQVIRATDRKGFFGINWDGSGGNAEANGLYWLAIGNP